MKKSSAQRGKNKRQLGASGPIDRLPVRWGDIPHDELYQRALDSMSPGSRERSHEDSLRHFLRRRLPELSTADHDGYIQIESGRIVETLRAIRDEYRRHLEEQGCKPIAEMYWVVFRLGVVQYAIKLLRETATSYIVRTRVPYDEWEILYGLSFPIQIPVSGTPRNSETPDTPDLDKIKRDIDGLVVEQALQRLLPGGPFGRDGQLLLTRRSPGFSFWGPGVTFPQIVERRQSLWDSCTPWTKGLANLFDSTQEEVEFQYSLLRRDAKEVEAQYVKLSVFEKIAYDQLVDMRRRTPDSRNLKESDWLKLFETLDNRGVMLAQGLTEIPRRVLQAARRRGHQISSWKECYEFRGVVITEDDKAHTLRREVMHAVHNAAKRAAYELNKVWGRST